MNKTLVFLGCLLSLFLLPVDLNAATITKDLWLGSTGDEVKTLQRDLGRVGFFVTEPGMETGRFGEKTLAAVKAFQCKSSIVCSGASFGYVGPRTRAALSDLASKAGPLPRVLGASTDMVSHLAFDGNTSDAIGGLSGVPAGNPAYAPGKIGQALSLDGASSVSFGDLSIFDFAASQSYSISYWFKGSAASVHVSKKMNAANTPGFSIGTIAHSGGRMSLNLSDGTDEANPSAAVSGVTGILNDQWHHVAMIVDRGSNIVKVYVDQVAGGSVSIAAIDSFASASSFVVGMNGNGSGKHVGTIDDLRVFSRALTDADIAELYALGGGVAPAPVSPPAPAVVQPGALSYDLAVSKAGSGQGTISASGIDCGSDCLGTYAPGSQVTVVASALPGSVFSGWSGGGCSGTAPCSLVVSGNAALIATFSAQAQAGQAGLPAYYVAPSGSNSNPGSESLPLLTIQKAADLARPGSIIYVRAGNYPEHVTTTQGGASDLQRIKFVAQGAVTMKGFTINHPYVSVSGFVTTKHDRPAVGFFNLNSSYSVIENNVIENGTMLMPTGARFSDGGPTGDTLTVPSGGLLAAGFGSAQVINIGSGTSLNSGQWKVQGITDSVITFSPDSVQSGGRSARPETVSGILGMAIQTQGVVIAANTDSNIVRGNTVRNLAGHGFSINGSNHQILNNEISNMNGFDIFRPFGSGTVIRGNFVGNSQPSAAFGNHPDVIQTFYTVAANTRFENMVFEKNFIMNMSGYQLGILEEDAAPSGTYRNLTFRNNVIYNVESFIESLMPEVHFYNNTFYRSNTIGAGGHPIAYSYGLSSGFDERSDGGNVSGNVFLHSGRPEADYGFYGINSNVVPGVTDYNYAAGAPAQGYLGKSALKFKELHGISGGDPKFRDVNSVLGPDNLPFTLDDGLKPSPQSLLCGKGPGGADIGAYSCDVGKVFADGSSGQVTVSQQPVQPSLPQPQGSGLVMHLDFESGWVSNGTVQDKSGSNNGATCQRSYYPNNNSNSTAIVADQCPSAVAVGPNNQAAEFTGSVCRLDSKYFGVQKNASIERLDRGSVSVWANYNPSTDPDFSVPFTMPNYQKILDTYSNSVNRSWTLGKDFTANTTFTANDGSGTPFTLIRFPDAGTSGSWHLYTVTWDGSTVTGYYDGAAFANNQFSQGNFSTFDMSQFLAIGALKHNSDRNTATGNCVNQYGAAIAGYGYPSNQAYVYPNAGFFNGKIDDVRIYNRALALSEIQALYSGWSNQQPAVQQPALPTDSDNDGIVDGSDLCPRTPLSFAGQVNRHGCIKPLIEGFDIRPDVEQDIREVLNLRFGKSGMGQVRFLEKVALVRDAQQVDVTSNLRIEKNKISMNSSSVQELNKRAELQFEAIDFANPKILKDGADCLAPDCIIRSFANRQVVVEVRGFSTYEIAEGSSPVIVSPAPPSSSGGGGSGVTTYGSGAIAQETSYQSAPALCLPGQAFDTRTGRRCDGEAAAIGARSAYYFSRSLSVGSKGEDVRQLQAFLNKAGFVVAQIGTGSLGKEGTYFGPATRAALARYQAAKGIRPAAGHFGPVTRAAVNGIQGTDASSVQAGKSSTLILGSRGQDVKTLRIKLRQAGYFSPYGSPGTPAAESLETSYFGPETEAAVRKFQCDKAIACSGTSRSSGWGVVGQQTKAALGIQ